MDAKEGTNARTMVLEALLNLQMDTSRLKDELRKFKWDCEEELVILGRDHLKKILNEYLNGQLREGTLNEWAELIEMRDDIGFEPENEDLLKEIIFELANPDINLQITPKRAKEYLQQLKK